MAKKFKVGDRVICLKEDTYDGMTFYVGDEAYVIFFDEDDSDLVTLGIFSDGGNFVGYSSHWTVVKDKAVAKNKVDEPPTPKVNAEALLELLKKKINEFEDETDDNEDRYDAYDVLEILQGLLKVGFNKTYEYEKVIVLKDIDA